MRLPEVGGMLDLSEKFTLRKRLDELAAANVNALILTEAQAETVLSLANQAGLYAMVEIAIGSDDFASPVRTFAATDRIANAVKGLRGHPALIGFLIDLPFEVDASAKPALDAIIRTVRKTDSRFLIALKRRAEWRTIALTDEDLVFVNLPKIDTADIGPIIYALHEIADARPLVIEIGEDLPGQDEVVARAFGFGAAGVVAPAMRRAVSSERQNIRMLSVGELLPFAHLKGSSVPLPASTPMVSVVVTARDDEDTIAACLESISRLQYPNYEVIVIDDASRDRSVEIVSNTPIVRLVRQSSRSGFGAIRNMATRVARGDLIAFTRADCIVDSDWLGLAVRAISEGGCDAIGGPVYAAPQERGIAARVISSLEKPGSTHAAGDRTVPLADRNIVVRKSSLIAVGGFDSRLIDEGGDLDLATRMTAAGITLGWCPAGFVWRCGHRTIGEFLRQRISHGRAEAMLSIKHPNRFGAAMKESDRTAGASRFRQIPTDRVRGGIIVRGLTTLLSASGVIVQVFARRHYTVAAGSAAVGIMASTGDASEAARSVAIRSNRAPAAHPTGR